MKKTQPHKFDFLLEDDLSIGEIFKDFGDTGHDGEESEKQGAVMQEVPEE